MNAPSVTTGVFREQAGFPWAGRASRLGERAGAWIRNYVGLASLMACPVLLLAFLATRYAVSPWVGVRAIFALYALGVVPGYLAERYLFGLRIGTPFERLLSGLLLGTFITPFLWYVLCCLKISVIFFPLMFVTAVVLPLAKGWHRQPVSRLRCLVSGAEAPVLWLALLLTVLWSWQLFLVSFRNGQVVILPHDDHLVHTSLIAELARGVPPAVVPFLVVARKWAYHYMPDVWCDMIRRAAGTDAREAYFYLALPLRYAFVTLACYLGLVRRFGRAAATLGGACVLGFCGYHGSEFLLTNWSLTYLYWNYPSSWGLVGVFLILYYASATQREHLRGPLLLISVLSGLLFWHKANFALVAVPAVAVFCAILLIRHRDYRWLAVCLGAQGALVAVRQIDLATADLPAPMLFEPFRFVRYMWWKGTLWLKTLEGSCSGWSALPIHALLTIRRNVDALPDPIKWPAVFLLCMVFLFHLGIFVAFCARLRCGFGRLRPHPRATDVLILLILLFCAVGFVLLPVQKGLVWNVCMHLFALVYALLFALMGPVLCDVVGRLRHAGPARAVIRGALVLAAMVGNTYALGRKALGPTADVQDVIPEDQYACYRYIEAHTSHDAMILHPRFEQGLKTAAMLTRRRVVLEWGPPVWEGRRDLTPLLSDLREFYRGATPQRARGVLDRYGVTHVVAEPSLVARAGYGEVLVPVFRAGGLAVYRVTRPHDIPAPLGRTPR